MTDLTAAPTPPALPPELLHARQLPFPDAATLDSMARLQRLAFYQRLKQEFRLQLTIDELRHIVELIAGKRAEDLKAKRSDTAAAKKASATPAKVPTLDDL